MPRPPLPGDVSPRTAHRLPLSTLPDSGRPDGVAQLEIGRPGRALWLYPGTFGYDLQEELEFLSHRAMEPTSSWA